MIKKAFLFIAAAWAFGAAAAVGIVALAFALYAFARDYVGPAGASAIVAGAAALILLSGGLAVAGAFKIPRKEPTLVDKILEFAREKPLVAAAAALAAGVFAVRNPTALMAFVMGMVERNASKRS